MSAAEVAERRRLHQELDRACVELDLDGLRFVALVARIRAMSADELEKLRGLLREQHPELAPLR